MLYEFENVVESMSHILKNDALNTDIVDDTKYLLFKAEEQHMAIDVACCFEEVIDDADAGGIPVTLKKRNKSLQDLRKEFQLLPAVFKTVFLNYFIRYNVRTPKSGKNKNNPYKFSLIFNDVFAAFSAYIKVYEEVETRRIKAMKAMKAAKNKKEIEWNRMKDYPSNTYDYYPYDYQPASGGTYL